MENSNDSYIGLAATAQIKRELERLRAENTNLHAAIIVQGKTIESLRVENAKLREDKARLDYLSSREASISDVCHELHINEDARAAIDAVSGH